MPRHGGKRAKQKTELDLKSKEWQELRQAIKKIDHVSDGE